MVTNIVGWCIKVRSEISNSRINVESAVKRVYRSQEETKVQIALKSLQSRRQPYLIGGRAPFK